MAKKITCPSCASTNVAAASESSACIECGLQWTKAEERERLKPLLARHKKKRYDKARAEAKKAAKE